MPGAANSVTVFFVSSRTHCVLGALQAVIVSDISVIMNGGMMPHGKVCSLEKIKSRGCRDGSVVKSTGCSCRGPRFGS